LRKSRVTSSTLLLVEVVLTLSRATSFKPYLERSTLRDSSTSVSVMFKQSAFNSLSKTLWTRKYFDCAKSSVYSLVRLILNPKISEFQHKLILLSFYSILGKSWKALSKSIFSMNAQSIMVMSIMSSYLLKSFYSCFSDSYFFLFWFTVLGILGFDIILSLLLVLILSIELFDCTSLSLFVDIITFVI